MAISRAVTWLEDTDCTSGKLWEGLRLIRLLEMRAVKSHEVAAGRIHVHRLSESMIIPCISHSQVGPMVLTTRVIGASRHQIACHACHFC